MFISSLCQSEFLVYFKLNEWSIENEYDLFGLLFLIIIGIPPRYAFHGNWGE